MSENKTSHPTSLVYDETFPNTSHQDEKKGKSSNDHIRLENIMSVFGIMEWIDQVHGIKEQKPIIKKFRELAEEILKEGDTKDLEKRDDCLKLLLDSALCYSQSLIEPEGNYKMSKKSGMVEGVHSDLLKFFEFGHLPEHLKQMSEPFCTMATSLVNNDKVKNKEEMIHCLRKLLEAKDCAVRSLL